MVNSRLQNATVSIDADGDVSSIDTTEMGQSPGAQEPEEENEYLGFARKWSERREPEVATEDQENHEE